MNRFHILVDGLVTVVVLSSSAHAATRYAKSDGAGSGDCLTWAAACTLTYALSKAVAGDEIWVAAGTYRPAGPGGDRAATFQLKNGVAIYGNPGTPYLFH